MNCDPSNPTYLNRTHFLSVYPLRPGTIESIKSVWANIKTAPIFQGNILRDNKSNLNDKFLYYINFIEISIAPHVWVWMYMCVCVCSIVVANKLFRYSYAWTSLDFSLSDFLLKHVRAKTYSCPYLWRSLLFPSLEKCICLYYIYWNLLYYLLTFVRIFVVTPFKLAGEKKEEKYSRISDLWHHIAKKTHYIVHPKKST